MQKYNSVWEIKQLKREQRNYFTQQNKKNEQIVIMLDEYQKRIDRTQQKLLLMVKNLDEKAILNSKYQTKLLMEKLNEMNEDMLQMKELMKDFILDQETNYLE